MAQDRRLGRFRLPHSSIEDNPDLVRAILGSMIVVRAESLFAEASIEYVAICDEFEPLSEHLQVPEYDIVVDEEEGTITFKRME